MKRFWVKVSKTDSCWDWMAARTSSGYGKFRIHGRLDQAHRLSFLWFRGPIPAGMFVLHRCDNRACVNPEHLFIGTAKTNAEDRDNKGRGIWNGGNRGSKHHETRLTEQQVKELRERYAAGGIGQTALASEYGIAQTTLGEIVRRKTWKHVL